MSMKIKDVKDLNLKTRWFDNMNDNDDMKIVNDMKDLDLKILWFEILICLRRLRMSRAKELIIEFKSNKKGKWSDLKFKILLLSYVLNSIFDNIIMIALGNRMLNDSKFDEVAIWCFVIINLANVIMMMMLLWLLYAVARPLSSITRYYKQINVL